MKGILKKSLVAALTLSMALSAAYIPSVNKVTEVQAAGDGYSLVWSDEFDGTSLNQSNWTYEIGRGEWGWGNNEQQYYTSRKDNVEVSNGTLKIKALKENYSGASYTSGRIKTQGKKSFLYGKIEARIKLPSFMGAWPAFWTLGENITSVGWPACGEIDIMEAINKEAKTYSTVHWSHGSDQADHGLNGGYSVDRTQWHTYSLEWTKDKFKFYVDGKIIFQHDITDSNQDEFRKKHFLLLNMAIGGQWPGYTIDDSAFPATMEVDYVRAYQKEEETTTQYTGPTITVTEDAVATSKAKWEGYFGENWTAAGSAGSITPATSAKAGCTLDVTKVGNEKWGVQASLKQLHYYPGATYTYTCTLTSTINKNVVVKVVGDDDGSILSEEIVALKANQPYNYKKQVTIPADYTGNLNLFFGLGGGINGESAAGATPLTFNAKNFSFVTTTKIPDPNHVAPTPGPNKETKPTVNTGDNDTSEIKLSKAKIKSVKSTKKKRAKVRIKKVKKAVGYQIKYSTKKNLKKYKIKKIKKLSYTFKKLKSKKRYYFKVRAYAKNKKKTVYGAWSSRKSVKVK